MHKDPHHGAALYATDTLRGRERRAFEAHLAHCQRCQTDFRRLAETAIVLAVEIEPIEPPPGLRERILAGARAEPRR